MGTSLNQVKLDLSKEMHLSKVPKNIEVRFHSGQALLTKPTRTISGVAPVAIMTKPFRCPEQAQCTFCPGGPGSVYGDTPKSYPGGSPAHMRAMRNDYDSYLQVFNRLEHYALLGQDFSKVELIIMGGTFLSYPKTYRDEFITYALKGMNDFSEMFFVDGKLQWEKFLAFFELPGDVKSEERLKKVQQKILKIKGETTLEKEQLRNETGQVRCVVFCIETRSDCSRMVHIDEVLRLGGTRVEIGVQSLSDDVLMKVKRGNSNQDNILATQLLRDSFLKVGYHMMVGLPGSTRTMDVDMFEQVFSDSRYRPDALKIYPCLVFKGTELYEEWKRGEFTPIDAKEAAERIVEMKRFIQPYCRVMRIQRDIPTQLVEAGVERTNLRQYVQDLMKKKGITCRCIRCREPKQQKIDWKHVKLQRLDYEASYGQEIFLSYEDKKQDLLLGFVRVRIPYQPYRKEITSDSAGVREIHVYGNAVGVGKERQEGDIQHRGLGKQLMEEAEKIAVEEFDKKKMLAISGIGAREWFKKLGYRKDGVYVSKLV
jgi:elongator complex protein 3